MSQYLVDLLAVLLGSAVGGAARYWVSGVVNRWLGERFPWGTLVANVSGAVLIGILAALATDSAALSAAPQAQLLLIVGVCGSYTTVSSFALQTLALARDAQWLPAAINVLASLGLCMLGVWLGFGLAMQALGLAASSP
ncbi:fluoride efflux transporter CrcB [Aquisalimonas sp.]|uniref:fluoride efflux transporter CrcB n=1 Tax=Aquisalimonas sp. TaxID=1872621 RepID=UPI0025BBAE1C|nr:fluoride efflux transporter CrcB [Aquisalimonas sp.]